MEHRCQACACACTHVDGSSGNRGGCGNPAEQGRDDVGHALPEEFAVGIVPVADSHCVGNRRRQQRFQRTESCDGDRCKQQGIQVLPRNLWPARSRQCRRDVADCLQAAVCQHVDGRCCSYQH